jgi:DNA topoisomerase-3
MTLSEKRARRILIIAEKPIQGREIAAALHEPNRERRDLPQGGVIGWKGSEQILVAWAEGHLMEMVKPDDIKPEWGSPWRADVLPINPPNQRIPLRPRPGAQGRLVTLAGWINEAKEVVNACDAGMEGELIFDEIAKFAGKKQDVDGWAVDFSRMWITDTRAEALRTAFNERRKSNLMRFQRQREAAQARADVDWLLGFNGTRYATCALRSEDLPMLVIGRVQTPTLTEVVTRARDIALFEPEPFLTLPLEFRGETGIAFDAQLVAFPELRHGNVDYHFKQLPEVQEIKSELWATMATPWKVTDMAEPREEFAPPPFDLLDLQRCAFRIYRWSASKTLQVAQALYAREKMITYPRTESCKAPVGMREQVEEMRDNLYYGWAQERFPELKGAILPCEDAHWEEGGAEHFAILPTGGIPQICNAEREMRDEYRLWELIAVRTILAWLPPAQIDAVKRLMMRPWKDDTFIRAFVEAEPVMDPGWLWWEDKMRNTRGYGKPLSTRLQEVALPISGKLAKLENIALRTGQTAPPKHYDEETLLGWMDRNNLGTAATRAEVIEDLSDYGYAVRIESGQIRCTPSGAKMIGLLEARIGNELTGVDYARQTEETIESIGSMAHERPTRERLWEGVIVKIRSIGAKLMQQPTDPNEALCPKTFLRVELSKDGRYFIFPGFKDVRCYCTMAKRVMHASDYAAIFAGKNRGAGPFQNFISQKGTPFPASVVFRPRKKSFEFLYKH